MKEFIVLGEVKAKQRPRFARRGNYVASYTPEQTVNYENLVKLSYQQAHKGFIYSRDIPLELEVIVYKSIPKSFSKKKTAQALNNELRPTTKPDIDNVVKLISDALNKVAYEDDKQIVKIKCEKYYAEKDYALIRINEVRS